jgi:hypothetical protein
MIRKEERRQPSECAGELQGAAQQDVLYAPSAEKLTHPIDQYKSHLKVCWSGVISH